MKLFRAAEALAGMLTAAFMGLFLAACATNPDYYRNIDGSVEDGSFSAALGALDSKSARKNIYTKKNTILYYLDRGMIEHYAGMYEESSGDLEEGERLIEAAFTKSISQEVATYIVNDNSRDYGGEDYEDLYINIFNALNYYHRNDLEDALVEIRRVNEKLQYLSDKYEIAADKVKNSSQGLAGEDYAVEAVKFSNSALARYLGVLFYRGSGRLDDARIDREELKNAYTLAPQVYYHPIPATVDEELEVPGGKGRLNIIGFAGLAPVKVEENVIIPLPLPAPNNWTRIALPHMVDRPSAITAVEVVLDSGERFELELLEDMGEVARETFKSSYSLMVLKSVARSIIKTTTVAVIGNQIDKENSGLGILFGIVGQIASTATERADTRMSRYFPRYAFAGGINLEPGIYTVTVNYYGNRGLVRSETRDNVRVLENSLNLREFVCLE